ncbi:unnamed protein product [Caretta caretta]
MVFGLQGPARLTAVIRGARGTPALRPEGTKHFLEYPALHGGADTRLGSLQEQALKPFPCYRFPPFTAARGTWHKYSN